MTAEEARSSTASALLISPAMDYVRRCINWMVDRGYFHVDIHYEKLPGSDAIYQIRTQLALEGYDMLDDIPGYLSISWEKRHEKEGRKRPFRKR